MIRAAGLAKRFDAPGGSVAAVADASFTVAAGEFVAVLGPSGCGKSTVLLMLAGLEAPSGGTLEIGGRPVTGPRPEIGLMFQDPTLLPWRTVLDNVLFPISMSGRPTAPHRPRAEALLRLTGLWEARERKPRQLSGGMRQRVALCRALVTDPTILLMDEPFSALDAITRDEMGLALAGMWDAAHAGGVPRTAVFITHSIREAVFLADRVLVMGRRPSCIVEDVAVPFPRPRDPAIEGDARFTALYLHLKATIAQHTRAAA